MTMNMECSDQLILFTPNVDALHPECHLAAAVRGKERVHTVHWRWPPAWWGRPLGQSKGSTSPLSNPNYCFCFLIFACNSHEETQKWGFCNWTKPSFRKDKKRNCCFFRMKRLIKFTVSYALVETGMDKFFWMVHSEGSSAGWHWKNDSHLQWFNFFILKSPNGWMYSWMRLHASHGWMRWFAGINQGTPAIERHSAQPIPPPTSSEATKKKKKRKKIRAARSHTQWTLLCVVDMKVLNQHSHTYSEQSSRRSMLIVVVVERWV